MSRCLYSCSLRFLMLPSYHLLSSGPRSPLRPGRNLGPLEKRKRGGSKKKLAILSHRRLLLPGHRCEAGRGSAEAAAQPPLGHDAKRGAAKTGCSRTSRTVPLATPQQARHLHRPCSAHGATGNSTRGPALASPLLDARCRWQLHKRTGACITSPRTVPLAIRRLHRLCFAQATF